MVLLSTHNICLDENKENVLFYFALLPGGLILIFILHFLAQRFFFGHIARKYRSPLSTHTIKVPINGLYTVKLVLKWPFQSMAYIQ